MPRTAKPAAPRVSAPDLPARLEPADGIRDDLFQRAIALETVTDAAHAELAECRVPAASVDSLTLTGATLVDVEIDELRATSVSARGSRLRRVRITGGRIGTLDLADSDLDEVELRGFRIDYLSLAAARAQDVVVDGCSIGTLDAPQAVLERVAFRDSRCDEVDTRALRATDLDMRGLAAAGITDPAGLRGATLTTWQVEQLAGAFAAALGIHVRD